MTEVAFLLKDPAFVEGNKIHNHSLGVCLFSPKQEVKNRKNAQTLFLRRTVNDFSSIE